MTLGPLMIDLAGTSLSSDEKDILKHPLIGGVILFSRNYESPEQVSKFIDDIHTARQPRPLVAVDHEGGRVQRFLKGFTKLPPAALIGDVYDADRKKGKHLAESCGWLMARELRAVGVDFSFAPILDINRNISTVIGDRAFHSNPEYISDIAHSYMTGMHHAGMAAVGKHFPGHGGVANDTHTSEAIDERGYEDIYSEDILPFIRMVQYGLPGIMTAHVTYPKVDNRPATFSSFWLKEVLRNRLEFQGVIFSDDLSMHAAESSGNMLQRAQTALAAGCDMILVCNDPEGVADVLDGLEYSDDAVSHMRLVRMHGGKSVNWTAMQREQAWLDTVRYVLGFERLV